METKCPICQSNADSKPVVVEKNNQQYIELGYTCPHCGEFQLPTTRVITHFSNLSNNNLFYLRCYMNERHVSPDLNHPLRLNTAELTRISECFPKTVDDKLNKILAYLLLNSHSFGEKVYLTPEVSYSQNPSELTSLVIELKSEGLIDASQYINGNASVSLTKKGYDYIKGRIINNQKNCCFVAMWFDPKMNYIWDKVIKPACEETGYRPIRIDKEQFNDDIIDNVFSSIKDSSFLIAELTGYRGGVYYEAGIAKGLGKQVIFCCKDKYSIKIKYEDSDKEVTENGPHFDVNHQKTIFWEDIKLGEYKQQLMDRILATIGRGSYLQDKNLH